MIMFTGIFTIMSGFVTGYYIKDDGIKRWPSVKPIIVVKMCCKLLHIIK